MGILQVPYEALCPVPREWAKRIEAFLNFPQDDVFEIFTDNTLSEPDRDIQLNLPKAYALALCRIEPENNVSMMLEAFAELDMSLVFVGNWDKKGYGWELKARYRNHPNVSIHDPIYDPGLLRIIRARASIYVHGHSAGEINPSLVEIDDAFWNPDLVAPMFVQP